MNNIIVSIRNISSIANEVPIHSILALMVIPDILWKILNLGQGSLSVISVIYIGIFVYLSEYRRFRKIAISIPLLIWLALTFYHLINASIKHVPEINYVDYLRGLKCYASICIFTFLLSIDAKRTFKGLFYTLAVWLVAAFLITGYTAGHRLNGEKVIAVSFGKNAALMAIAGIYWSIIVRESIFTIAYKLVFPVLVIILAQARNAFGMVGIMFIGYYYSMVMKCKMNVKQIILVIFLFVLSMIFIDYIMNNTGLGDRFNHDFEEVAQDTYKAQHETGTAFDYVAGERIIYYVTGWEIFMKHPWTGIGLDNYQNYMRGNYPMHVEYMVHLAEGGIIAAILWLSFIASLIWIIVKTKIPKPKKSLAWVTFGAILFACLFSVMYETELSMAFYGIIISMAYPSAGNFFNTKNSLVTFKKKISKLEKV